MATKENKDAVMKFWQEVFNKRKLDLADSLFTDDYVYHGAAGQDVKGKAGLKQFLSVYFNAFPDMHAEVEDIFGEGDKILSRARCTGTHKGSLMGIPPTGKKITIMVICADRLKDGKMAESFELPDMFGMMQQLGAIPAAA